MGTYLNCLFQTHFLQFSVKLTEMFTQYFLIVWKQRMFLLVTSVSICFLHQVNLLVATNVAEEGLDIQTCCLVVRFDLPQTVSSFIQSRGRARMRTSEYVFLLERYFLVSLMSPSSCIRICLY